MLDRLYISVRSWVFFRDLSEEKKRCHRTPGRYATGVGPRKAKDAPCIVDRLCIGTRSYILFPGMTAAPYRPETKGCAQAALAPCLCVKQCAESSPSYAPSPIRQPTCLNTELVAL